MTEIPETYRWRLAIIRMREYALRLKAEAAGGEESEGVRWLNLIWMPKKRLCCGVR